LPIYSLRTLFYLNLSAKITNKKYKSKVDKEKVQNKYRKGEERISHPPNNHTKNHQQPPSVPFS